jgi:hypothetical protein
VVEEATEESTDEEAPVEVDESSEAEVSGDPIAEDVATSFTHRAYLAGYGRDEIKGRLEDELPSDFDFTMPDRPGLPRIVREKNYAELERAVRSMSFRVEVPVIEIRQVPFELPNGHGLSAEKLQDLFAALIDAQSRSEEPPSLSTFTGEGEDDSSDEDEG